MNFHLFNKISLGVGAVIDQVQVPVDACSVWDSELL